MLAACLLGVILSILAVGLVSGTMVRHLVVVAPVVLVLGVGRWNRDVASWMAISIFVVWFAVTVTIWLHLIGLLEIVDETYSPAEVFLSFVIAAFSAVGIAKGLRLGGVLTLRGRMIAVLVGIALQTTFIGMSLRLFD